MKLIRVLLCASMLIAFAHATPGYSRTIVKQTGHYIIYATPLKELADGDKVQALEEAKTYGVEKLKILLADNPTLVDFIDQFDANVPAVSSIVDRSNDLLAKLNLEDEGFRIQDLIPSGLLVTIGGKITAGLALSGGGSGSLGLVLVPKRMERFSVREQRITYSWFEMDWTIVGLGSGDLGPGAGGGASVRIAAGPIWGELSNATDFYGTMAGPSVGASALIGQNNKVFAVKRTYSDWKIQNIVGLIGIEFGPQADLEPIHGNLGQIVPLQGVLKALFPIEEPHNFSEMEE